MQVLAELQELIGQLSQSEKRYFRIYAARHVRGGQQAYLDLYQVLEKGKAKEVGVGQLKTKLKWTDKKIRASGNYLYSLLLRSLRAFAQEKTVAIQLHDLQDTAALLSGRGLVLQADRLLQRAEALVEKTEDYLQALAIHAQRRALKQGAPGQSEAKARLMALLLEEARHEARYTQLLQAVREGGDLNVSAVPAGEAPATGFFARLYQLAALAIRAHVQSRLPAAETHYLAAKQHWEAHPFLCACHPGRYQAACTNYQSIRAQRQSHPAQHPNGAPQTNGATRPQPWQHFRSVLVPQLAAHLHRAEFAAAQALVPALSAGLDRFVRQISPGLSMRLRYNLLVLHFLQGEVAGALGWVRSISAQPAHGQRPDIRDLARLLELLLQWEQGNLRLLPYLLRNARRYLRQQKRLGPLELALLGFVRGALAAVDRQDVQAAYAALVEALQGLETGRPVLGLSECLIWARAKLRGESAVVVAREALRAL